MNEPLTGPTPPMVVVEHLTRRYGSGSAAVTALDDVSLTVPTGAVVAVAGRSGSGKTTLLNCIGGLDSPTSGAIIVDGANVTRMSERQRTAMRRTRVSFVFQTFGLVPMLTAIENVGLPLRLQGMRPAEREARVAELLEMVGLAGHGQQRPAELSGGQQQRVAIARALAGKPRLLIADEPTGQLDADTGAQILALLKDVVSAQGMTALISTHDPTLMAAADLTIRLSDGRLVDESTLATPQGAPSP